jgi:hypothetical protein
MEDLDGRDCTELPRCEQHSVAGRNTLLQQPPGKPVTSTKTSGTTAPSTPSSARAAGTTTPTMASSVTASTADGELRGTRAGSVATCANFLDHTGENFDPGEGTLSCYSKSETDPCTGDFCFRTQGQQVRRDARCISTSRYASAATTVR